MAKLKLSAIPDNTPVKLTVEPPAAVHRDLVEYAEVLSRESAQKRGPVKLIAPVLARFMATDRAFARLRRDKRDAGQAVRTPVGRSETAPTGRPVADEFGRRSRASERLDKL